MKKKALDLLGYEFYYELSNHVGSPLNDEEHPEIYTKLMEIQALLNKDLDEKLRQHDIKLEEMSESIEGRSEGEEENEQEPEAAEAVWESD